MTDGLITGRLHVRPARRAGKSGKSFVTAKVQSAAGDGEALFVNVIAFADCVADDLLTLDGGDSVSIAGAPRRQSQTILVTFAFRQS